MQIDLRHASPDLIEADIAIVGAGAAGITMARRLVAGGRRVILLESGGLDYESDTAALNAGFNVGEPGPCTLRSCGPGTGSGRLLGLGSHAVKDTAATTARLAKASDFIR